MWTCGCNWAEKHLDFCLQDSNGTVVLRSRVDNNENGFNAILAEFSKFDINPLQISFAIESLMSGWLIFFYLVESRSIPLIQPPLINTDKV